MRPVPLQRLAEYMRDAELIDMRVLHGEEMVTLERVRIEEMIVRRDDEALTAKQEFVDNGTTMMHDLVIECDNIMWARPTSFELATVNPVRAVEPEPESLVDTAGVIDRAWEGAADASDIVLDIPRWRGMVMDGSWGPGSACIDIRHLVILTAWHTSDLPPDSICKLVGYHSQQPFLTAMHKCHLTAYEEKQIRRGNGDFKHRKIQVKNWRAHLKTAVKTAIRLGGTHRSDDRRLAWWALD